MGRILMSSCDWFSTAGALRAIGEAGASLIQAASDAAKKISESTESTENANEALSADAQKAEEEKAAVAKAAKPAAKPLDEGAVVTAKNTVSAVMTIAEAVANLDEYKALSSAAVSLTGLFGGSLLVEKGQNKLSELSLVTSDRKLRVEKINDTAKLGDEFSRLFQNYDKQAGNRTGSLLEVSNIYDELRAGEAKLPQATQSKPVQKDAAVPPEACAARVTQDAAKALEGNYEYIDSRGHKTVVSGEQGNVRVVTTDAEGKVITEISKSSDQTDVIHNGEHGVRKPDGSIEFTGNGFRMVIKDGRRQIFLNDGRELIRDGAGAQIRDNRTGQHFDLSEHQFKSACLSGLLLTIARQEDDLEKLTREILRDLKPDQAAMLVIKGHGSRTIFGDGTIMDVRPDRTARITTSDGHVFIMDKDGRFLYELADGKTAPLDRDNLPPHIKYKDGRFRIGDMELDPTEMRVIAQRMSVKLSTGESTYTGHNGVQTIVQTRLDGSTQVQDGDTVIDNSGENGKVSVKSLTNPEHDLLLDLTTHTIETKLFTDTPESLTVKATGTVIRPSGVIEFGGGPVLFADGSVKVDDRTFIGADCSVRSDCGAEGKASSVANDGAAKAAGVYGKALSGIVRSADVAALSGALGDVVGLIGTVLPGSTAYARLMVSYSQICSAINFATPKAHAAELAISKGIGDETSLKHVEDNTLSASPEQAAEMEERTLHHGDQAIVEFVPRGYWLEVKTAS